MGPIVVMARRPSLHIPVPPEDVQDEVGHIQTIARISSFQSEMAGTAVLQGDPPQWVVQVRPGRLNFDLTSACTAKSLPMLLEPTVTTPLSQSLLRIKSCVPLQGLAQELRRRLRLNLFNFDLLRPSADQPGRPSQATAWQEPVRVRRALWPLLSMSLMIHISLAALFCVPV